MTIREYCANRARSVRKLAIVLGVLFLLSCSFYVTIAKVQINSWYIAGAATVLIATIMSIGMRRIRCPRCDTNLQRVAYNELAPRLALTTCPQCNVSLDEPMNLPENPTMG
jgi:hypothetical protein